jgi:hypothetical protein
VNGEVVSEFGLEFRSGEIWIFLFWENLKVVLKIIDNFSEKSRFSRDLYCFVNFVGFC